MTQSSTSESPKTAEELRLGEAREKAVPWRQWGGIGKLMAAGVSAAGRRC